MKRVFLWMLIAAGLAAAAPAPAEAQSRRRLTDPATGESYNVEVSLGFWKPTPDFVISSEGFGIPGTPIDLVEDLGIEKRQFREFRAVLRPARKHKFRIQFIPIKYEVENAILTRQIVFNGIRYDVGLPVNATADWKAWRFGYEYDFISRDRGYLGLVVEAKYTDVRLELQSPAADEFSRAQAPIPSLGLIGRGYLAKNVSITGEFTGFRLLNREDDDYQGNYYDFDIYGTINFSNNVGASVGYRSLDVGYLIVDPPARDFGDLTLKGVYFMGTVRF